MHLLELLRKQALAVSSVSIIATDVPREAVAAPG